MKKSFLGLCVFAVVLTGCGSDPTLTVVGSSLSTAASRANPLFALGDALGRAPTGSPTSLKLTAFRFFLSTNADCTSPIVAGEVASAGQEFDFYAAPTFFTGEPAAGTYQCFGIEANDILSFQVDATAAGAFGGCAEGTDYSGDLYRQGESDDGDWKDSNGTAIDATGSAATPSADKVVFWATTDQAAAKAGALGIHENQILPLTGALTVPGTVTFYADFNNGVDGDGTSCKVEQGSLGFR